MARSGSVLIDGSELNATLAAPVCALTLPKTGTVNVADARSCLLLFGGAGAEDATFNYKLQAWVSFPAASGSAERVWVPRAIASGVVTLGTEVYTIDGLAANGAAGRWADGVTDTLSVQVTANVSVGLVDVYSPADETKAWLQVDCRFFEALEVETQIATAHNADVFYVLDSE